MKSRRKYSALTLATCSFVVTMTGCSSSSDTKSGVKTTKVSSPSASSSSVSSSAAANYQRVTSYSGGYSFEIPSSWIYADGKTDLNTSAGLNQLKKVEKLNGVVPSDMASDLNDFKKWRSLYATGTTKRGLSTDAVIVERSQPYTSVPSVAEVQKDYSKNKDLFVSDRMVQTSLGEANEVESHGHYQGAQFQNVLLYVLAPKSKKVEVIGVSTTDRGATTELTKHIEDSLQPAG